MNQTLKAESTHAVKNFGDGTSDKMTGGQNTPQKLMDSEQLNSKKPPEQKRSIFYKRNEQERDPSNKSGKSSSDFVAMEFKDDHDSVNDFEMKEEIIEEALGNFQALDEEHADRDRPQINLKHVIPQRKGAIDSSVFDNTIQLNPVFPDHIMDTPLRSSKKSRTEPEKNSSHRESVNSPVPDVDEMLPNHKPSIFQKSILKPSQTVRIPKQEIDPNSPSKKNVKFAANRDK